MQVPLGQPFTTSLVDPPGSIRDLGARVEVPVTRAIVSYWVAATLTGALWTITLDPPLSPGDYQLVWRDSGPEPPEFEAFIPLVVVEGAIVDSAPADFPAPDPAAVRPTVAAIAALERTRTASGGGGTVDEFTDDTEPSAGEVEDTIDQAVPAVLSLLQSRFPVTYYERVTHAVALYTAMLLEGSFFREQIGEGSVDLWRNLFSTQITSIRGAIDLDLNQQRMLRRIEVPVDTVPHWRGRVG